MTVARHVARAGKTRPVMTEAQIDEAVVLYREGWTLHNLGQRLGVADQTIRRVLVERAVTIRPGGRRTTAAGGVESPVAKRPRDDHRVLMVCRTAESGHLFRSNPDTRAALSGHPCG